jgi:hypothetical protein
MNRQIRLYSPDGRDETTSAGSETGMTTGGQSAGGEQEPIAERDNDSSSAGHLTNARLDAKSDGGDQANVRGGDSTILGSGGTAGGLSGNGDRTDEYDAAVMGLDD